MDSPSPCVKQPEILCTIIILGLECIKDYVMVQLRERLSLMKVAEEEQIKEKRVTIKKAKEVKHKLPVENTYAGFFHALAV